MSEQNFIKSKLYNIKKTGAYVKRYGLVKLTRKAIEKYAAKDNYDDIRVRESVRPEQLEEQKKWFFANTPVISILVPVYETPETFLYQMLESVQKQSYANWQLCIADGGSYKLQDKIEEFFKDDDRLKYKALESNLGIAKNTNEALAMADGEYIILLDHDDLLEPDALFEIVKTINDENPDVIYTDEDKVSTDLSHYFQPYRKPDYNRLLITTNNYICHIFAVRTTIAREAGGFNSEYDGSQDFDFILKCTERAETIKHIPRVLYHWRIHEGSSANNPLCKMYAYEAGKKAIESHLGRRGLDADVVCLDDLGFYRLNYKLEEYPHVKILVFDSTGKNEASRFFAYLRNNTDYPDFESVAVKDSSPDIIKKVDAEYFFILNTDTVIKDKNWLKALVSCCIAEQADAVVPKIVNHNRTIAYNGISQISDNRFTPSLIGKPWWYKGRFNCGILQQDVDVIPRVGILVKKEAYLKLVYNNQAVYFDRFENPRKQLRMIYEPNVTLYMA